MAPSGTAPAPHGAWTFGRYRLDLGEHRLTAGAEVLALTPKAFDLLVHLVERSDRLVRREELLTALWPDTIVEDGTLARHVSALRKVIEREPGEHFLETVPKSGYRFLGARRAGDDAGLVEPSPGGPPERLPAEDRPAPPAARRESTRAASERSRWIPLAAAAVTFITLAALAARGFQRAADSPPASTPVAGGPAAAARPTEPDAAEAYRRARHFLSRRTAVDLHTASGLFEQVLAQRPDDAAAEAGWATTLVLLAGSEDPVRNVAAARAHAVRALTLEPRCVEAHAALGLMAENHDGDWAEAERAYRAALAVDPEDVTANHWLGELLVLRGRVGEGLPLLERALRQDATSRIVANDIVKALGIAGRYDDAIARADALLATDPAFAQAYLWRAFAYLHRNRPGDAARGVADARVVVRLDDAPFARGFLAWALGRAGESAEARSLLAELESERRTTFIRPLAFAFAHLGLGERAAAVRELEHELDSGGSLLGVDVVQPWQALRSEPGFAALLRRAKLDARSS